MIVIDRETFKSLYEHHPKALRVLEWLYVKDDGTGVIKSSTLKISDATGLTRQVVRGAINTLVEYGILQEPTTDRQSTIYQINKLSYNPPKPTQNEQITNEQPTNNQRMCCKSGTYKDLQPTNNQRITNEDVEYIEITNEQPTSNQRDTSLSVSYTKSQPTNNQRTTNEPLFKERDEENEKEKEKLSPYNPFIKEKEKEKEDEKENIIGVTKLRFVPPTLQEVEAYIKEKGYTDIDASHWWHFYDSKNWMIGKNKMVRWKSAIATWHNKNKKDNRYGNNRNSTREERQSAVADIIARRLAQSGCG